MSVPESDALATWREKRAFLIKELAIASNPAQKFELRKQIEEAEAEIAGFAHWATGTPVSGATPGGDLDSGHSIEQAISRLGDRLDELFALKDGQDRIKLEQLARDSEAAQKELTRVELELKKATSSDSRRNLSHRVERLRNEIQRLLVERGSLDGERTLTFGGAAERRREALMHDLERTTRWAQEIAFLDSKRSRRLDEIYVHLEIFLYPRRIRGTENEKAPTIPFERLLSWTDKHIALLGQAGAGKTTSMKRLFLTLSEHSPNSLPPSLPVLIRLRDLYRRPSSADDGLDPGVLYGPLLRALKIQLDVGEKLRRPRHRAELIEQERMVVASLLDAANATVILDGFDELVGTENRESALAEIRELVVSLARARVVLTSRTGDFNYGIEGMEQFEIAPLDSPQIIRFAQNWLGDPALADDFVAQVERSPFKDTTIRPLSLAHLCAIYERVGIVPDRPKTVYRKVVGLLLEDWDEQRSVRRESAFQAFTSDRKFDFLASLAFVLTSKLSATAFGTETLSRAYELIYSEFGLPSSGVHHVITEIEAHTGLFLRVGSDQFEFAHKSLQEYLAAEYIVRLPSMPKDPLLLSRLPNELAITIAISSQPAAYLADLALDVLHRQQVPRSFYNVFMDRLALEHPDLGANLDAAMALIVLVSLWSSRGGRSDAKTTPLEIPRAALDRFCAQFADILRGPGTEALRKNYFDTLERNNGFTVMKRILRPREHRNPTRLFIPDRLADLVCAR